jgi:hypothetical protein
MTHFSLLTAAWTILNLLILLGWLGLTIAALIIIGRRRLEPVREWLWTALVILVPVLGALAFLIVAPGKAEN